MKEIVVTRRTSDYHACKNGRSQIWEAGRSVSEAVGKLVRSHPEIFKIKVMEKKQRSVLLPR